MRATEPDRTRSNAAHLRFAPSPNGRLHLGHAFSALLNAEIAGILGGSLSLRIEDIDPVRSKPALIAAIRDDLAWLGIRVSGPVRRQSEHLADYAGARDRLAAAGLAYRCFCSRGQIRAAADPAGARDPDGAPLYPGTCRGLPAGEIGRRVAAGAPHTWRLDMARALAAAPGPHAYTAFAPGEADRTVPADPARWGDAVIARRDVPTSYHLAVVWDDAVQRITHVVRGRDLEASTDLHVLLQRLLGLPTPRYHHHRLIRDETGDKLAKSRGSVALSDLRAAGATPDDIAAALNRPVPGSGRTGP